MTTNAGPIPDTPETAVETTKTATGDRCRCDIGAIDYIGCAVCLPNADTFLRDHIAIIDATPADTFDPTCVLCEFGDEPGHEH